MSLLEFAALSERERARVLFTQGELLCEVEDELGDSAFYALGKFYVEVRWRLNGDEIAAFTAGQRYERMLEGISLGV